MQRPAVFLDRDDTLIDCRAVTPDGDLGDPALVRLRPGVLEGCRALKRAGFVLVVVTNQGGVARGKYGLAAVDRVHRRVNELLGGAIDAFRACPYHPQGTVAEFRREHPWRKPAPGMILDAAETLGLDLARSWVVGDTQRDCEAGRAAGCRTVLLTDGSDPSGPSAAGAGATAPSFARAVRIILSDLDPETPAGALPGRVLIVAPTWVGDVVMATPALALLRERLPGAFFGALLKPTVDELLAGSGLFDEVHVDSRQGAVGVARAARKIRPRRYDAALLLTNSFSTALIARIAGVPRRIGFARDGRSALLTERLHAPRRGETPPFDRDASRLKRWAPRSACAHYLDLAGRLLGEPDPPLGPMSLGLTDAQTEAGDEILHRAGIARDQPFVVLNPGGNNPAKRWPAARFAELARSMESERGLATLVSGSPSERDLAAFIVARAGLGAERSLPALGLTLGSLKRVLQRASLLITNDTGPRHIAAAFETPVVTLFGPTDPRWTTIPFTFERILVADPTLPDCSVADDHPERCRVDRIELAEVQAAAATLLANAHAPA